MFQIIIHDENYFCVIITKLHTGIAKGKVCYSLLLLGCLKVRLKAKKELLNKKAI